MAVSNSNTVTNYLDPCLGKSFEQAVDAAWGGMQEIALLVSHVAIEACRWLPTPSGLKNLYAKPLYHFKQWVEMLGGEVSPQLALAATHAKVVQAVTGCAEVLPKALALANPVRQFTIMNFTAPKATAAQASIVEQVAKKTAEVFDFLISVADCVDYGRAIRLYDMSKDTLWNFTWFTTGIRSLFSGYNLLEECVKMVNGTVIDQNSGVATQMNAGQRALNIIKIALNISYLALALLTAMALLSIAVPHAAYWQLVFSTTVVASSITSHFVKKLAV